MLYLFIAIQSLLLGANFSVTDSVPPKYLRLWRDNVTPLLQQSVWRDNKTRYDAAHLLMVPLHAAFALDRRDWQAQFLEHFERFQRSRPPEEYPSADELSRLQYNYLASEFLVLSAEAGKNVPAGLAESLQRQVVALWTIRPAWQWAHAPFPGMRARLVWKLRAEHPAKSYYAAITDHEEYVFAITADLLRYDRLTHNRDTVSTALRDILAVARATYTQRVVFGPDGGWLFQPGAWADHPDYLYAGRDRKMAGMPPSPLPDVAEDASHSFRLPLWLLSMQGGARDSSEARYYCGLRAGLEQQFFDHVLKPPTAAFPAYRLSNWMDGRNGVYRWNYSGRGTTWGYGPYELSSTFTLGWWVFLGSARIRSAYEEEWRRVPFSPVVLATYFPDLSATSRTTSRIVADPLGSFRELLLYFAARMPTERLLPNPDRGGQDFLSLNCGPSRNPR